MIPLNLKKMMARVLEKNYEIYIVGGAVRDTMMGRPIKDWDLTTSARPEIIEEIFDKTIDIGIKFGTIQVHYGDDIYEVTTYRKDSLKSDGRKPDFVEFTSSLKEDLSRRDFTINAMVMNKDGDIFDAFEGKDSIKNKMLYTVGNASERFKEDYLRVYRYVRLTQELGFNRNLDLDNVIKNIPINKVVSFERINAEFSKILLSDQPSKGLLHLKDLNLLTHIVPELSATYDFDQHSKYHHLNVFDHTLSVVDQTPNNLILRLAALFHDIGKPSTFQLLKGEGHFYGHDKISEIMAIKCLKRLKYSNDVIKQVSVLIKNHMRLLDIHNTASIKKFIRKIDQKHIFMWLDLRKADIKSCHTQETLEIIEALESEIKRILHEIPPLTVNDLNVSGYDLIALGYKGKMIGEIKRKLLEIVDENPSFNDKSLMLNFVKEHFEEYK